jgi:toxin ParE1/3/4
MAYLVRIMPRAERDLADVYAAVDVPNSDAASRWFARLERAILTLEQSPARSPVTPENKNFRHLLYGKKPHVYRVVYRILERQKEVEILHIRHGAMDRFRPGEL